MGGTTNNLVHPEEASGGGDLFVDIADVAERATISKYEGFKRPTLRRRAHPVPGLCKDDHTLLVFDVRPQQLVELAVGEFPGESFTGAYLEGSAEFLFGCRFAYLLGCQTIPYAKCVLREATRLVPPEESLSFRGGTESGEGGFPVTFVLAAKQVALGPRLYFVLTDTGVVLT